MARRRPPSIELFGVPGEDLHPALNAITSAVGGGEVSITNGIFVHQGFPVGAPFLHTLATQYGTGVHPVDFTAPGTAQLINDWISEQTHGRIPSIYREDRSVRLAVANTIYLDAKWALPFGGATATVPMPFRTAAGPVTVPMMQQVAEIPYAEGDGWQAAELAYRDSDLVMRILLPVSSGRLPRTWPSRSATVTALTLPPGSSSRRSPWRCRSASAPRSPPARPGRCALLHLAHERAVALQPGHVQRHRDTPGLRGEHRLAGQAAAGRRLELGGDQLRAGQRLRLPVARGPR